MTEIATHSIGRTGPPTSRADSSRHRPIVDAIDDMTESPGAVGSTGLAARLTQAAAEDAIDQPKLSSQRANVNVLNQGEKADMGESTAVHGVEVSVTPAA